METSINRIINQPTNDRERERLEKRMMILHTSDAVVLITGDMEPGARSNKILIPALEHMVGIRQALSKSVESISIWVRIHQVNQNKG